MRAYLSIFPIDRTQSVMAFINEEAPRIKTSEFASHQGAWLNFDFGNVLIEIDPRSKHSSVSST
jgi:hypothetical protein